MCAKTGVSKIVVSAADRSTDNICSTQSDAIFLKSRSRRTTGVRSGCGRAFCFGGSKPASCGLSEKVHRKQVWSHRSRKPCQDRPRMFLRLLLRWVQTCFLWTFSESPQEAGLNPPKQKSQDHARPVGSGGGSRARAHSLRQGLPPIVQELFPTHPTYHNPIFINPRPPFM